MNTQNNKCCLCNKKYIGYGHNAQPIKDGRCCDKCNSQKVILRRLEILEMEHLK